MMRWPWQPDVEVIQASRTIITRTERLTARLEAAVEQLERIIEQEGNDGDDEQQRWTGPSGIVR
jgi:hypothetical protein